MALAYCLPQVLNHRYWSDFEDILYFGKEETCKSQCTRSRPLWKKEDCFCTITLIQLKMSGPDFVSVMNKPKLGVVKKSQMVKVT